jgi:putative ABC transport system permease protein
MFQHYLKIGWRNLLKNRTYGIINIGGLAAGMAVTILIGLWINDELSFNRHFKHYDHIGHVMTHSEDGTYPSSPVPLAPELRSSFSEDFVHVVLSTWTQEYSIAFGERNFLQTGNFMEAGAGEMLSLEMVFGTRDAIRDPATILISQSLASKLFPSENPMGKVVRIKNSVDLKVGGVYKDIPHNTDFHDVTFIGSWEFLVSWMTWMKDQSERWDDNSYKIYVQLKPHADFESVSSKIKNLKKDHLGEKAASDPELFIHPMKLWHLYSSFAERKTVASEKVRIIWLYGTIGFFVLILACINFMNLSTARSEKRCKEVGVRKVMGSRKRQIVGQFLSESFLTVLFALILTLILVAAVLPWFNSIEEKQVSIPWSSSYFWMSTFGFLLVTGLLAGSYPALYLSSFQPVKVLKGVFRSGRFVAVPRKVLVTLQFSVSVTLIIGTIVIYQQIEFARKRSVGYDRDGLLSVYMITPDLYQHYETIKNELISVRAATHVATSSGPITEIWSSNSGITWKNKDPNMESNFITSRVTHDYGATVGWQFVEGRDFSRQFASDSNAIVINEAAARYMGLNDPTSESIQWHNKTFPIVGVIRDVLMGSPYEPIKPTLFLLDYNNIYTINIRLNPQMSDSEAVSIISKIFRKYNPSVPFQYRFVSDEYNMKFKEENKLGILTFVFAGLAILISSLGLFGLSSFMAEQRTKEIGIRKVVGASISQIWQLLSKEFIQLSILGSVIACPLAYYCLSNWLQNYQYKIEISLWVFMYVLAGATVLTLITVSIQCIKAAAANPIESLRSE